MDMNFHHYSHLCDEFTIPRSSRFPHLIATLPFAVLHFTPLMEPARHEIEEQISRSIEFSLQYAFAPSVTCCLIYSIVDRNTLRRNPDFGCAHGPAAGAKPVETGTVDTCSKKPPSPVPSCRDMREPSFSAPLHVQ